MGRCLRVIAPSITQFLSSIPSFCKVLLSLAPFDHQFRDSKFVSHHQHLQHVFILGLSNPKELWRTCFFWGCQHVQHVFFGGQSNPFQPPFRTVAIFKAHRDPLLDRCRARKGTRRPTAEQAAASSAPTGRSPLHPTATCLRLGPLSLRRWEGGSIWSCGTKQLWLDHVII